MADVLKEEDTQERRSHEDRQGQVILPKAKEHTKDYWQPSKVEEARKGSSLEPSEGGTWPVDNLISDI